MRTNSVDAKSHDSILFWNLNEKGRTIAWADHMTRRTTTARLKKTHRMVFSAAESLTALISALATWAFKMSTACRAQITSCHRGDLFENR